MKFPNWRVTRRMTALWVAVAVAVAVVPAGAVAAVSTINRAAPPGVDLILFNGKISTMDSDNNIVQAIAIDRGEIVAVGNNGFVNRLGGSNTTRVDLNDRRVLPGLIDGHLHGMRNAYHCFSQTVRLDLVTSRDEALAAYAAKASELDDGRWIWTTAGGWNVNQLDTPEIFTFHELTAAAPSNPLWIAGSGFAGPRVNQATLDELGLSAGDPGVVLDPDTGQPTGQLTAPATAMANAAILDHLDTFTMEDRANCLADFMRVSNGLGLTSWKDAGGNQAPWGPAGEIGQNLRVREPAMLLYRNGGFTVRIAYHDMSNYEGPAQAIIENRTRIAPLGDDMFRFLGPGEDTMATSPGYADFTRFAAEKRLSVETHVGNHNAILDGFEAANEVYPISELNWSIAHPGNNTPTDEQLARAEALGIGYTLSFSGVRNGAVGPRYRSTMESGVKMCLQSDAMNVAPWAPFQNLWYVTTGDTLIPGVSGVPEEQRLTREEALRHATSECAWTMAQDETLGSLEVGKHGDLIVLSDDYFEVPDDQIKDLRSLLTVVDGRIVYADGEFAGLDD
jgi:predicted amidohydrolase YtcJ